MTIALKPLPPEEALTYFRSKGYRDSFAWQDVWQEEHNRAFVVAKNMRLDILADIREAVDRALADGTTFEDFSRRLRPTLERKGWWGKVSMTDPLTGQTDMVQAGSLRRLRVIFDTNIRMAHAAGDWVKIQRVKDRRPYLLYSAILDGRTRPLHRKWSGWVLHVDDPWWDTHYPPNGWFCRCKVIQLSAADVRRRGLQVVTAPEIQTVKWKNPRTGEYIYVPEGIDPGFAYNVGKEHMRSLVPPPASGPLEVHAINPPATTRMPRARPADPARRLPALGTPGAPDERGYIERFLAEFGASWDKPAIWRDALDDPMIISPDIFRQSRGDYKVAKRSRETGLLLVADAIKSPDEIWWIWEQSQKTGRWSLRRRYLTQWTLDGAETPALAVFDIGEDGWRGVTAFTPPTTNYLQNQRKGVLAYRRPDTASENEDDGKT